MIPGPIWAEHFGTTVLLTSATSRQALVVVNTVDHARRMFRLLEERADVTVRHLFTRMCPAHRGTGLDKVRALLASDEPVLLVSTQLIEAGVDVAGREQLVSVAVNRPRGKSDGVGPAGRREPKRGQVLNRRPAGDLVGRGRAAVLSGWLAVVAGAGEQTEQVTADLVPHDAGKRSAAPGPPAAGAASTRRGGLVRVEDPPQRVDGTGVLTGSVQLGEFVQHRADELTSLGVISQPGHGPGRQVQHRVRPGRRRG